MKKIRNILFIFALIVSSSLFGQAVFTSSCGYSVTVYIKPTEIITKLANGGYHYEVKFHYDVVVSGPTTCVDGNALNNFQVLIGCSKLGSTNGSYNLPMALTNSSGFLTTTTNQFAGNSVGISSSQATVDNFGCNNIQVIMSGPGMPWQTQNLNPSALPIELISFDAIANQNQVDLSWITGSEKNNDFFTIERTVGGIVYEEVAKIEGQGNSSSKTIYEYTDTRPLSGVSYYRLKQTDYNGESEVFDPVSVFFINLNEYIKVYPNPNKGSFELEFYSDTQKSYPNSNIIITDMLGKVIENRNIDIVNGTNKINFELNIESGSYIIYLVNDGTKVLSKRFIIK